MKERLKNLRARLKKNETDAVIITDEMNIAYPTVEHYFQAAKTLDKNERKRIFERFYQAGGNTSEGGLGLGLNIVSGLVEGMGGSVEVRPREGGGSVFCVRLPGDGKVSRGGV